MSKLPIKNVAGLRSTKKHSGEEEIREEDQEQEQHSQCFVKKFVRLWWVDP